MLKVAVPVALLVVAFSQFGSTFWNWEQTAGMNGSFVCNISDELANQTAYVLVDRYAPLNDPDRRAYVVKSDASFRTSRVVKKMTPFLPALDVYHKCFDPSTRNCTCYLKFRLGVDPSNGELAKCVQGARSYSAGPRRGANSPTSTSRTTPPSATTSGVRANSPRG